MPPRPKSKRTASLPLIVKDVKQVAARPVMLLVLGPHRSGTSLTARMLECLGAENSRNLNPPNFANPRGYFEDFDIYQFSEKVLLPRLGGEWFRVSPVDWSCVSKAERSRLGLQALEIVRRNYSLSNPLSVLKEPRINNTLPFWLSLLEHAGFDVRFVCVVRDPVSAARSLAERDGFSLAHGAMIYLSAWLSALSHLQDRQVAFVQFDEVFASPSKVLAKVADKLNLPLPSDFEQRVHQFTSGHLDPSLRHSSLPREDVMLEPDLPPLVADLYRVLLDAAQGQSIRKTAKFVAYAEGQIQHLAPFLADYDAAQAKIASLRDESDIAERDNLAARVAALEAERSGLAIRHSALAAALEQLQGQHSTLVTENEALRSDHSARSALHSALATERDALSSRLASLESEHAEAVTRHSAVAAAFEKLQGEHTALLNLHSSLAAESSALKARLVAAESARQQAIEELQSIRESHQNLESTQASLLQDKNHDKAQLAELSTRLALLEIEKSELVSRRDLLATETETLRSDHASLVTERGALASRLSALEAERDALAIRFSKLSASQEDLAQAIEERDRIARERDALGVRLVKLERAHQLLASAERSATRAHQDLKSRHHAMETQLAAHLRELDSMAAELESATQQKSALETHIAALEAANTELAAHNKQLAATHHTLESQRSSLLAKHSKLEERLQERDRELAELSKHMLSLQDRLHQSDAERDASAARLSVAEAQHSEVCARLAAERDAHRAGAAERTRELAVLTKSLVGVQQDLERALVLTWDVGPMGVVVERTQLGRGQDQAPHRHLDIHFHDIKHRGRQIDSLSYRLVEHHARFGFCLFAPLAGGAPLDSWQEHGAEDGKPYTLVIPGNRSGLRALKQFSAADLALLLTFLTAAERALHASLIANDRREERGAQLERWLDCVEALRQPLTSAFHKKRA